MCDFAVVVIGASLGGIDALQKLAAGLEPHTPATFFIVQHIGRHRSVLPAILNCQATRQTDPLTP